jgi:hypothetical protein
MPEYRTRLFRSLNSNPKLLHILFLMLNPSTAPEVAGDGKDDMTVRKCTGFTARWGGRCFSVGNMFSIRATDPLELIRQPYGINVGPDNDAALKDMIDRADMIVAAWGSYPRSFCKSVGIGSRLQELYGMLSGRELHCIGLTHRGDPLHPSRAGYTPTPILYRPLDL